MNWYLVKLVYRIICGHGNHPAQFDEQLRLINADDELHAFHKARLIGEGEGNAMQVQRSPAVQWKFIDVSEMLLLGPLADGAEIYAQVNEQADTAAYIRNTQLKAKQLLEQALQQFTVTNSMSIG